MLLDLCSDRAEKVLHNLFPSNNWGCGGEGKTGRATGITSDYHQAVVLEEGLERNKKRMANHLGTSLDWSGSISRS